MTEENQENQVNLTLASSQVNTAGEFEIIAITAGEGNGWEFSEEALQKSLELWDGRQVFVDHSYWGAHSVRDLAGVLYEPCWEPASRGVKLKLKPVGPSGSLLAEIGKQILANPAVSPNVGFSADVFFTAKDKKVVQITKVQSVDLVINPARGGAFIRALNSALPDYFKQEVTSMPETVVSNVGADGIRLSSSVQSEAEATSKLAAEQARIRATMAEEAKAAHELRVQMCQQFVESSLAAANLPKTAQDQIRKQFANVVFEPAELSDAITSMKSVIAEATAGAIIQGPGRISGMFSSRDQAQAATDDLLGAPREKGMEGLKVHPLSGIRELYMLTTGDFDLHGGYYPSQAQLANTADFPGMVKNALNKIVINTWDILGKAGYTWWDKITAKQHFNRLQQITGILVGTVGSLPAIAEGGEYTELAVGDNPETASFVKYGGYIPLTLELIDRDDTEKLAVYPRELASAGMRKISSLVAAIFTTASGVGPTMADTGALFNNTAVTTAGGHNNLGTAALAEATLETAKQTIYNQPMLTKQSGSYIGVGPAQAVDGRFLLVPRALQLTAMKLVYPTLQNATSIYSQNQQQGLPGDVVTVPDWSDANDWALVADPLIAPAIYIADRFGLVPQIFIANEDQSPAVFMNNECRMKIRHFLAVWVNDYRPLYKANVP